MDKLREKSAYTTSIIRNTMSSILRLLGLLVFTGIHALFASELETERIVVPIGGNSWVRGGVQEKVTKDGFENWTDAGAILDTYIRFAENGPVKLFLKAGITGSSKVRITLGKTSKDVLLAAGVAQEYYIGEWTIPSGGYQKIELRGLTKTGASFGTPTEWILEGENLASTTAFVKNNQDNYFYWGRRGPSVHLNYPTSAAENIEWFYNEVTVPKGQDIIGSYFMANGFAEGYFGMQVNSEDERRILFSVWSPFKTDNPEAIPEDQRINMVQKGQNVYTGEFGNEGAGGQSYLKYNWKAGNTYRFLLQGRPTGDSTTTYTAYFYAPEEGKWQLIASFKRPKTDTYLKRLHSFLENFIPTTGDTPRRVYFGNQWTRSADGFWKEITESKFSADATARKGFRLDFVGGAEKRRYYLQNCGFFNETTPIGETFRRRASQKTPRIAWGDLPK